MLRNKRHTEILRLSNDLRFVSVQDLSRRLGVSEVTIRKDLNYLEENGLMVRLHGGAKLAQDQEQTKILHIRQKENLDAKTRIAQKARALLQEGDTVFIDAGSTGAILAEEIKLMNLRVATNSLTVMSILAECPEITLIAVGGNYRKEAGSFIGPIAMENLKKMQVETCFVGATGFTKEGIFSAQNILEAQLKSDILKISQRRIIIADSSKQDNKAFSVFANPPDVNILITDAGLKYRDELAASGIEVIIAT